MAQSLPRGSLTQSFTGQSVSWRLQVGKGGLGGSCHGNAGGRGSRARSCQDRVIKEAGEESRDNARGDSREFRNLRRAHGCRTSSPVIAVQQESG